jgi:hypothetical protein
VPERPGRLGVHHAGEPLGGLGAIHTASSETNLAVAVADLRMNGDQNQPRFPDVNYDRVSSLF